MGAIQEKLVSGDEKRSPLIILLVLVFLHAALAIPLAWILNIWADEASTLYTTGHGVSHALQNAVADEKQAPLYFWVLSLWRALSGSIFFARFFSVVCSLLAIKFFYDLARRHFSPNTAIFASTVFALHPFMIWASLEIRAYSMIMLLAVLLLKFFDQGFASNTSQRRSRIRFFIFAVVGLYTSYYIGFLLVGCFAALLVLRRWRMALNYLLWMLPTGLMFVPLLRVVYLQFSSHPASYREARTLTEGFQVVWNFLLTFTLPTEIFTHENATVVSTVRVWLVRIAIVAVIALLIKTRKLFDEKILSYAAITVVICGFFFISYMLLGPVYTQIRHAAVLFVPVFLLVALVFDRILSVHPVKRIAPSAIALILLASFTYSIYSIYPKLTKRGDWARVAAYIAANEKTGQPVVVFTVFDVLALPQYYTGVNKIFPDERFFDWELQGPFGSEGSAQKETNFVISEIPPETNELWLVVNEKCLATKACLPLENFVKSNYTIIEEKEFYLEKVFLLRRKQ